MTTTELTTSHLDTLMCFQHEATDGVFTRVFGNAAGYHLWTKFTAYDNDLLRLCNQMDPANLERLVAHLNSEGVNHE